MFEIIFILRFTIYILLVPDQKQEATQTSPKLSSCSPRKRKLQQEVNTLKKTCLRLSKSPEQQENMMNISTEMVIDFCQKNLNKPVADFITLQLRLSGKKQKGFRYTATLKQFALTVYFLGPIVYRYLQGIFSLPHKATLF